MRKETTKSLDITHLSCPMTFVHTRLELDRLESGQSLSLTLRDGTTRNNVTASVRALGHCISVETSLPDGLALLVVIKK